MSKNNTSFLIACIHCTLNFSTPLVMGIVNVTPDSFYDGGKHDSISRAIEKAITLINQGASIIDIGGQSTRPNAIMITANEELDRIATVVEAIRNFDKKICISIDTFYSSVATASVALGADIINDVSAGNMDENMLTTIAKLQVPYIMMHMQGTPSTMQNAPTYDNIVANVMENLQSKIDKCASLNIQQLIIDPGFGFGKTTAHNYTMLKNLEQFKALQRPILVGISRKGMIYKPLQINASEALNGTTALHMVALQNGANILRVHDVVEAIQTITLFKELQNA